MTGVEPGGSGWTEENDRPIIGSHGQCPWRSATTLGYCGWRVISVWPEAPRLNFQSLPSRVLCVVTPYVMFDSETLERITSSSIAGDLGLIIRTHFQVIPGCLP